MKRKSRKPTGSDEATLPFVDPIPTRHPEPAVKRLRYPVWTENKAKLIERYLYYFVLITHHGTYIDGFAGPQQPDKTEMWAAALVLNSEPRWLRHFYLFDEDKGQVAKLVKLKQHHLKENPERDVQIYPGDFNKRVIGLLRSQQITEKEATFCLLDQRTFECNWDTVKAIAEYKKSENKIELFYFLAIHWLQRALSATQDEQVVAWWGRADSHELRGLSGADIAERLCERMRTELRYKSAKAWPIYERQTGGAIMYYMVHATDHPEAPLLMARAYNKAVEPKEAMKQLKLELPNTAIGEK